jgi:hypothetical protein
MKVIAMRLHKTFWNEVDSSVCITLNLFSYAIFLKVVFHENRKIRFKS